MICCLDPVDHLNNALNNSTVTARVGKKPLQNWKQTNNQSVETANLVSAQLKTQPPFA